jgi:hypothetical protein
MLADIIQFHPGDSLEEILALSASKQQVSDWTSLPGWSHVPYLP